MDPLVSTADLREAAYMVVIPQGQKVDKALERLIQKAQVRLFAKSPSLERRIASGAIDADLVAGVIEDMVMRVVRNPNAHRQASIDDFTRMIDAAMSTGALYVSEDELKLVAPPRRRRGARSIRMRVPSWRLP